MHALRGISFWYAIFVTMAGAAYAQDYPVKPIRIVCPEAGGGADLLARLLAQGMSGPLGQQIVVENRGGNVAVSAEPVAKAPADGYTLLVAGSILWLAPFLQDNLPYDPVRDFSPVSLATTSPNILVVHPSLPVNSVKELIAFAKARPGQLNYASGASGGPTHLSAELFKSMAHVNIVRIPYRGNASAISALIGGEDDMMFAIASAAIPLMKAKRVKGLAVTSTKPSALLPELPTLAASGLPGYEAVVSFGIFAPAMTSSAIVTRLNAEIGRVLLASDVKPKLLASGMEPIASTPQQLQSAMKAEMTTMGKLIKDNGIRAE